MPPIRNKAATNMHEDTGSNGKTGLLFRASDVTLIEQSRHAQSREPNCTKGSLLLNNRTSIQPFGLHVEWFPYDADASLTGIVDATSAERGELSSPSFSSSSSSSSSPTRPVTFELMELTSFKFTRPVEGRIRITFVLKDGSSKPPMDMKYAVYENLVSILLKHINITRSRHDPFLCIVDDPRRKSMLAADRPALSDLFSASGSIAAQGTDFLKRFYQDPVTTTMGSFAKVTNMLGDVVEQVVKADQPMDESQYEELRTAMSLVRLEEEPDQGFEVISFHTIQLPPVPEVQRREPLSANEWREYFDENGRIMRVSQLKESVFRGGVDENIRRDVWKYLLGYYKFDATYAERESNAIHLRARYEKLKSQWRLIEPDQERRWAQMRERKDLVDKDVQRTDRNHEYFSGESHADIHLDKLNNILMSYCMWNWDLGYVQGMSDLLAPILVIMDDESDAFWCFDGFMAMVHLFVCMHVPVQHLNFDMDKMKKQLENLGLLLKIIDPKLHQYIQKNDSGQLFFCFRWLLILFKREFCFPDLMRLWEVLWTGLRCRNFQLLVALAILENERLMLIENKFGLNEILKHINDLAMHIDVEKTLKRAEGMYLQMANVPDLPDEVRGILGLPSLFSQKSHHGDSGNTNNNGTRQRLAKSNSSSRSTSPFSQLPAVRQLPHSNSSALHHHQQSASTINRQSTRYARSTEEIDMGHILLT